MAESTLTEAYADLRRAIGRAMSLGRDPANWDADTIQDVADFIKEGVSMLRVPPIPGGYAWKWLRPRHTLALWSSLAVDEDVTVTGVHNAGATTLTATEAKFYPAMVGHSITITDVGTFTITAYTSATVVVVSGDATAAAKTFAITATGNYRLPDDYAGIDGDLSIVSQSQLYQPLKVVNERQIEKLRSGAAFSTGTPTMVALRPVALDMTVGQRWDLLAYPTPNRLYTVEYRGQTNGSTLSAVNIYAAGAPYSLCLKLACIAAAERTLRDGEGPHYEAFMRQLIATIDYDRRAHGAKTVGPNLDRGQQSLDRYARDREFVTYHGQQYGPN